MPPDDPSVASGEATPVCGWLLRIWFNVGDYRGRVDRGELLADPAKNGNPNPSLGRPPGKKPLPPGARSQTRLYRDPRTRAIVAKVHRMVTQSGKAITNWDPKWMHAGYPGGIEAGHTESGRCEPRSMCGVWSDLAKSERAYPPPDEPQQ